jgi:hypothetical protein
LIGNESDLSPLLPDDAVVAARGSAISAAAQESESHVGRRKAGLSVGAGALVIVLVTAAVLAGGSSKSTPAYGAELVRFAESTPLLLLDEPGWRVSYVNEGRRAPGKPLERNMEFVTGSRASLKARLTRAEHKRHVLPPDVRRAMQSRVQLYWKDSGLSRLVWRDGKLGVNQYNSYLKRRITYFEPGRAFETTIPGLGVTAYLDPRDEPRGFIGGGRGNRSMVAMWTEAGHLLELRAVVPDLAAFEERLSWLSKVDSQAWLDALPPRVVKAADRDHAVREMLKGIPLPATFKPSRVPSVGLAMDRYQLGAAVAGSVTCLWFRQWGQARRTGDVGAANEAEDAMASARRWPILREMEKEGAYPDVIWQLAGSMPSGVWQYGPHRWRLLPKAEGLGCARMGLPVLAWKQKLQREREAGGGAS